MRTALITGAAGGIGSVLCDHFESAGYRVVGVDRQFPEGTSVLRPSRIELRADIDGFCDESGGLGELGRQVRAHLDADGLAVVVNNAAVQLLGGTDIASRQDWNTTLRTNVVAPFLIVQEFMGDLERVGGSVVNVASVHATQTKPGFVAYATSKAALVGMTKAMAVDLAGRIRVNAILPAAVATPMLLAGFAGRAAELHALGAMHPSGRIAKPSEIASVAEFLASDSASFVNGATWEVDGAISGRLHDPQ